MKNKNCCEFKNKLAEHLDINPRTLATWLNKRYFSDLQKIGYSKHQKILTPEQMKFLSIKLGFEL